MIGIERIEDWRGQTVVDQAGESLGKLDEVFYAPGTGEPVLIAVKSGLLGRKSSLIPLKGATAGRDHLQVTYTKETIEATAEIHRGETPTPEELGELGAAYGTRFETEEPLQSASDLEARRASAAEARARAEQAAEEQRARQVESEEAAERARRAADEAAAAERAAHAAKLAADEARRDAEQRRL